MGGGTLSDGGVADGEVEGVAMGVALDVTRAVAVTVGVMSTTGSDACGLSTLDVFAAVVVVRAAVGVTAPVAMVAVIGDGICCRSTGSLRAAGRAMALYTPSTLARPETSAVWNRRTMKTPYRALAGDVRSLYWRLSP